MSVLFAANLFAAAGDDGHSEEAGHAAGATTEAATQAAGWFLTHAYLIPIIPAVAFALIIFFGKRIPDIKVGKYTLPGGGSLIGVASMLGSLTLAVGTAVQWINRVGDSESGEGALHSVAAFGRSFVPSAEGGEHAAAYIQPVIKEWTWWQSGGIHFGWGQHIDGLSVMLLLLVAFISTLVQIFSLEYLKGDRRYTHFFAALTLFSGGMLAMVLAPNMVQLILGWEIMGLCSFMLIGHWWEEAANSRAALKAFFTVRVGDVGLLVGTAVLLGASGTLDIEKINEWAAGGAGGHSAELTIAAVALFIACIGKSGQFPLHTWLPDAMAGPTPVSSLLHSSTMVVAGVFLVARVYPVFFEGLNILGSGVNLIAVIGGITIIVAAALAFVQNDIKKVLAYSTVSQLGYMMMGLGVGAYTPAVFHIFTHAFFKCCLFLCAGSVSHSGAGHSFDMKENMGGLYKKMPVTAWCWMFSTAALCGVPLLTSGFYSKDEIIDYANHNDYFVFFVIGLVGVFMTTAYMTRATYLTFFGTPRGAAALTETVIDDHGHEIHAPHESNWLIKFPLVVLAFLAIVAGFLNAAPLKIEKFTEWVEPHGQLPIVHAEFKWINILPSTILLILGFLVSLTVCKALYSAATSSLKGLTKRSAPLRWGYTFLWNKLYLDALYEGVIVKAIAHPIAQATYWVNQHIIDGVVNGAGTTGKALGGWTYRNIDQRVVDGAVNGAGKTARGSGGALQPTQSGKVSQYGALLFSAAAVGALVLVIINT
jgi:NADH-quinone oxidoreductase subunit L